MGLLAVALAAPEPVSAATLTVTDLGDSGAPGQLRTLINSAALGDTIVIPAGTITLTGELLVDKDLAIGGAGPVLTTIDGGGIDRVFEVMTITNTIAISNMTIRNGNATVGGAILNQPSTVDYPGTLALSNITVSGNTAELGGGIYNFAGTMTLTNATISDNSASVDGGGIFNFGALTLTNVAIFGNTARSGGGMWTGSATLTNVTISGNTARSTGGGAESIGQLTLTNVTLSGNTASNGLAGGALSLQSPAHLKNTLITNSPSGGNCAFVGGASVISLGHNLDSGATCGFTGPSDLSKTDPNLGPLQDNGGLTATHALLPGSPAIDAGTNAGCRPTDQRGIVRPQGAACDIGAYEFAPLTLRLNQSIFHSGSVLRVGLTAQNPKPAFNADFYFAILLPDGVGICFITSLSPLTAQCLPLSDDLKTFPPLAANILVPQGLDATLSDLMAFTFGGGEPQGAYSVFMLLTVPGAFSDGSIDSGDIIAVGAQSFTFSP